MLQLSHVPVVIYLNRSMSRIFTSAGIHSASILKRFKQMIKSAIALAAAAPLMAAPALAGPYVNVESNASWAETTTLVQLLIFTLVLVVLLAKTHPGMFREDLQSLPLTALRMRPVTLVRLVLPLI